jgi:phosphomannomutase
VVFCVQPFTAKRVGAALGLMITASHNPAADNGYKVCIQRADSSGRFKH